MVLHEYFSRFILMLKVAEKIDAKEKLDLIIISSVSDMEKNDRDKVIDYYTNIFSKDSKIDKKIIEKERQLLRSKLKQ